MTSHEIRKIPWAVLVAADTDSARIELRRRVGRAAKVPINSRRDSTSRRGRGAYAEVWFADVISLAAYRMGWIEIRSRAQTGRVPNGEEKALKAAKAHYMVELGLRLGILSARVPGDSGDVFAALHKAILHHAILVPENRALGLHLQQEELAEMEPKERGAALRRWKKRREAAEGPALVLLDAYQEGRLAPPWRATETLEKNP